jgi:transposase-like protein
VGLIEALTHPSQQVKRLLEMAVTWEDVPPDTVLIPARPYRTMRHLDAMEIDDLVKAYGDGATVYELAKQFGIHRSTVGKHLQACGVDTTPPALRPEDVAAAAELYCSGLSLARVGSKFGVAASTVREHLIAAGLTMRERHGGRCRSSVGESKKPT